MRQYTPMESSLEIIFKINAISRIVESLLKQTQLEIFILLLGLLQKMLFTYVKYELVIMEDKSKIKVVTLIFVFFRDKKLIYR